MLMPERIPRPPSEVLWVHIPKCGSSFEATVKLHGGRLYEGDGAHSPIAANATDGELSRLAVMFRQPEERLFSTYAWLQRMHVHCCAVVDFGWQGGRERYDVLERIRHGEPARTVLAPYVGCQLNMLLGHKCHSRPTLVPTYDPQRAPPHYVRLAKQRIDQLFYVGLVSEWELSVCLFNFKMTGVRYTTALQLKNCRPTAPPSGRNVTATTATRKGGRTLLAASGRHIEPSNPVPDKHVAQDDVQTDAQRASGPNTLPIDHLDHAVFEHAQARFWREVRQHRISAASCASASNLSASQPQISSCNGRGIRLDQPTLAKLRFKRLFPSAQRLFT